MSFLDQIPWTIVWNGNHCFLPPFFASLCPSFLLYVLVCLYQFHVHAYLFSSFSLHFSLVPCLSFHHRFLFFPLFTSTFTSLLHLSWFNLPSYPFLSFVSFFSPFPVTLSNFTSFISSFFPFFLVSFLSFFHAFLTAFCFTCICLSYSPSFLTSLLQYLFLPSLCSTFIPCLFPPFLAFVVVFLSSFLSSLLPSLRPSVCLFLVGAGSKHETCL